MKKEPREIRCFDYVNRSYERVRQALQQDAPGVFRSATKSAVYRAESVATELHFDFGPVGVKADVKIRVKSVEEQAGGSSSPAMRLQIEWEAASTPGLFPVMNAELSVYPLTPTETQLDFFGHYEPPFGAVGKAMNAIAGYRIAEASVHRFLNEVAEYLRRTLA